MKTAQMQVELVDIMGSDMSVVNAARVSFAKESDWEYDKEGDTFLPEKDKKLIRYLAKHNHWTPFAHTCLSFRIKAPLFVARQLGKHQVGLVWNEVSRRYVDDEPEFYLPEVWRKRADNVKQGSSDIPVDEVAVRWGDEDGEYTTTQPMQEAAKALCTVANELYNGALASGVCPEMARMLLPQNMLTEWIWTGSLMAFIRVCKLRLDPHTQKETQECVKPLAEALQQYFPVSYAALMGEE